MDRSLKRSKISHDGAGEFPSKPTSRFTPIESGRSWTVSVALPGSVIEDAHTTDQQVALPGRLGRALALHNIDEVILYDDTQASKRPAHIDPKSYTADTDPCHFLSHVLSYLETPPFMRKALFPLHQNLRLASKLPSLDVPHHPHPAEWIPYREGVTLSRKSKTGGTLVEVGLKDPVSLPDAIPPNTRVTVYMDTPTSPARAIHPADPRTEGGYYWGFSIRRAKGIGAVFTESPYEEGYDVSIGTSERGRPIHRSVPSGSLDFKHLLIVFGGPKGIEYAVSNDEDLGGLEVTGSKARELFDHWVNVLPGMGSRNMRTDEALFIGLTSLGSLWAQ
ncbi:hypothetical protein Cpir12675_000294 [Ceratocystis pirilliformis]|uniref:Deoxyribose-phosphate aldolase n=1 Tax=Ceratocystis pirilliformis TaxID=259994 RepID=A0ABR3ZNY4_9PEZI